MSMHEAHVLDLFHYGDNGSFSPKKEVMVKEPKRQTTVVRTSEIIISEKKFSKSDKLSIGDKVRYILAKNGIVQYKPEPKANVKKAKSVEIFQELPEKKLVSKPDPNVKIEVLSAIVNNNVREVIFKHEGVVMKYINGRVIPENAITSKVLLSVVNLLPTLNFIHIQ